MTLIAGIDIGGTSVKVGIVDADGRVLARKQQQIVASEQAPARVVGLAYALLQQALEELKRIKKDLFAVGVGCPGILRANGVIHAASNFPSWSDVPLQQLFVERLDGLQVHVCNDADAAILAEQWVGTAKQNVKNFIMLTLGTGVGFSIISDGKLVRGGTNAIEGGHMIVERNGRLCGCTQRGCLEAYSSAGALVLEAQEHMTAGADSTLAAYPLESITAKLIFELAAEGDPMCTRLIAEAADYLGFACVTLCRMLDPEMIVLSGGMAEAGDVFLQEVRSAYSRYSWSKFPNPDRQAVDTVDPQVPNTPRFPMKVALVGCTHGELDAIYAKVDQLNAEAAAPSERIKLILCCGDFESLRNSNDLKCKACPPRYHHMNSFHEYYRGEKRASVLTVFVGGNHEASNYLQELQYGGWVAPNIFYLGAAGVINVGGVRIAGISGIYYAKHYHKGHFERAPYNKDAVKSVYCVREFEVYQLSHLAPSSGSASASGTGKSRLDAFMSHDWPTHIENHGDIDALFAQRPDFRHSINTNAFGNPGSELLLDTLRPAKWLAGHMHVRFEAQVKHGTDSEGSGEKSSEQTHFLALSKCLPGKACLEVLDLPGSTETSLENDDDDLRVMMDVEWFAILRATHYLASRSRAKAALPTEKMDVDVDWVEKRLNEEMVNGSFNKVRGEWITDFMMTAPPLGQESSDASEFHLGNPQTDALLAFLELPHMVTTPFSG